MKRLAMTDKEARAMRWAYEELIDFYELDDANLDEEEMQTDFYRDVLSQLRRILVRSGFSDGELPCVPAALLKR